MSGAPPPLPARCVVDASVLAKLFLPEDDADLAAYLLQRTDEDASHSIPDLAYLECANIFWKWVRRGLLSAELARESTADLLKLPLDVWPAEHLAERALELALSLEVSVYDGTYLALADLLGVSLITADASLRRKASPSSIDVRLLEAFRPQGAS